ncbi:MAG: sigma 54-interacting transcriptional regulator [Deltaproteobacteria bacterium]|nr:sigma 54-interacting transcriptional regulator [Deltaproteobacteria bacterium]
MDSEIDYGLRQILEFFQVDRAGVLRSLPHKSAYQITHAVYSQYVPSVPVGVELSMSLYPWVSEKLAKKCEVVSFSRLDDLPPEASVDKQRYAEWGIRSGLDIPIITGGSAVHVIAINSVKNERVWPEDLIPRLRLLGEIFVNALERRDKEQALRESEERLSLAVASADARLWELDLDTEMIWSTEEGRDPYRLVPGQDLPFARFLAHVHPADRERIVESLEKAKSGEHVNVEYRVTVTPGNLMWVNTQGRLLIDASGKARRLMGISIDITERKAMEAQLREQLGEIERLKLQLEDENIYLREELGREMGFGNIIGKSAALNYVLFRAGQVAPTDAAVLILGETGTGKGLIANAIHGQSSRRDKPMVTVNCAALPANLIESELFGREKGAFTGAHARQAGRFEVADGGTIFLDEIGELPLELQSKLLRVLQDGEFERLGSAKTIKVDVRVIASTSRDLRKEAQAGRFREDLYYRLNVFPVSIPPLRERVTDIPELVRFFVDKYSRKFGRRIETIPKTAMKALEDYSWPGNVRELEHVIERAVITTEDTVFRLADRLEPLRVAGAADAPLKDLASMEREHILRVLRETGWRIEGPQGAARILNLHPSTLRLRMKKLGIRRT